jgi:tetratricopeptide (TPR) repeat protein
MGLFGKKKSDEEIIHDVTFGATELANKGGSYIQQERFLEAIQELDEALKLRSGYKRALILKGVALNGLDKNEEALAGYDEVVRISDGLYENVWVYKAETLFKLKKYEEAVKCFDKSIERHPEYFETYLSKAKSLMKLGRFQEALACHNETIRKNNECAEVWHGRGLTMKLLGKDEAAVNGALQNAKDYGYGE